MLEEELTTLIERLQKRTVIEEPESLDLKNKDLTDAQLGRLLEAIGEFGRVSVLNLSGNPLTGVGLASLVRFVEKNMCLREVTLTGCPALLPVMLVLTQKPLYQLNHHLLINRQTILDNSQSFVTDLSKLKKVVAAAYDTYLSTSQDNSAVSENSQSSTGSFMFAAHGPRGFDRAESLVTAVNGKEKATEAWDSIITYYKVRGGQWEDRSFKKILLDGIIAKFGNCCGLPVEYSNAGAVAFIKVLTAENKGQAALAAASATTTSASTPKRR